jgi:hypothetical protein
LNSSRSEAPGLLMAAPPSTRQQHQISRPFLVGTFTARVFPA